jgi:hypothetical protein
MQLAGYFILISAALHVAGVALAGFAGDTLFLLGPAALYAMLYAGLARGMMWVAWIAFVAMLGGSMGAISELFAVSPVPAWVFAGILGTDICAAILLFGAIWRGRPSRGV